MSKLELTPCSTAAMRSSPAPVSIEGRGNGLSEPSASISNCMKTRFHSSIQPSGSLDSSAKKRAARASMASSPSASPR